MCVMDNINYNNSIIVPSTDRVKTQPRHLPGPEAAIQAFHITLNSPLLQSASILEQPLTCSSEVLHCSSH